MINLSSLSALLRAIRPANAADAAPSAVMRVQGIKPVAEDDAGAMLATALRQQPRPHVAAASEDILPDDVHGVAARASRSSGAEHARSPNASVAHAPLPATVQSPSTALELTAAARLLQAALKGSGLRAPAPAAIASSQPLVERAHAPVEHIARALEQAIATSGLFYESHLARVLKRDYSLAALSREPQAAWPSGMHAHDAVPSTPGASTDAASTMLAKQLDLLDTRALTWSGDVWPGQRASIAIREDLEGEAADDADDTPAASTWRMQLALDLPSLGPVKASILLREQRVDVTLTAANESAQLRLDAARPRLATSLDVADIMAGRIEIDRARDR